MKIKSTFPEMPLIHASEEYKTARVWFNDNGVNVSLPFAEMWPEEDRRAED